MCSLVGTAVCSILQPLSNTHVDILPVYPILALSRCFLPISSLSVLDTQLARHRLLPPASGTAFAIGARFACHEIQAKLNSIEPNYLWETTTIFTATNAIEPGVNPDRPPRLGRTDGLDQ